MGRGFSEWTEAAIEGFLGWVTALLRRSQIPALSRTAGTAPSARITTAVAGWAGRGRGSVLREDRARAAGPTAAPADAFIGGRRTGIPGRVASGHDRCAAVADEEPGLCAPAPVSGRPRGRSRVSQGHGMSGGWEQLTRGFRPPGPKAQSTNSCAVRIIEVQSASLVSAESKALARVFLHAATSLRATGR